MKGEARVLRLLRLPRDCSSFSMTCLVMGGNLLMLYLGWEGVGLCSYLADRLLLPASRRRRRGQEGVPGQPHRRLRVSPSASCSAFTPSIPSPTSTPAVTACWTWHRKSVVHNAGNSPGGGSGATARSKSPPCSTFRSCSCWARSANRHSFPLYVWLPDAMEGPYAGFSPDSRRDDGHRRHLHARPLRPPYSSPTKSAI